MKQLYLPDLHIEEKAPKNRIDDYEETVLGKFNFIYETADKYDVEYILQPGDFTNSPNLSWSFYIKLGKIIKRNRKVIMITVHGQHSLRYRTAGNTVLDALHSHHENLVLLLKNSYYTIFPQEIDVYGCGYGEKIPKPKDNNCNILLIHKMIISNKKVWEGQKDITWAKNFLRKNESYNVIVSGDNHSQFEVEYNNRFLFNCGTLLRSGIDYVDYKPHMILFDTEALSYKKIYIPIKPADEVFNLKKIKEENENDKKMEEFVNGIKESKNIGLNFKENLFKHIKENKISDEVKEVFTSAFKEIGSKNNE